MLGGKSIRETQIFIKQNLKTEKITLSWGGVVSQLGRGA